MQTSPEPARGCGGDEVAAGLGGATCNPAVRFGTACSVRLAGTKAAWLSGRCFDFFSVSPYEMTACRGSDVSRDSAWLDPGVCGGEIVAPVEGSGVKLFYFMCPRKQSRHLSGL